MTSLASSSSSISVRAATCRDSISRGRRPRAAVSASAAAASDSSQPAVQLSTGRRAVLSAAALVLAGSGAGLGTAAAPASTEYKDDVDRYTVAVPAGWERGEGAAAGAIGTRRVVVFHPVGDLTTTLTVLTSNASVELTKMGALGNALEFGIHLTASQNRSRRGDIQTAELLSAEERNGAYIVEYTISRPSAGIARHLYSLATLRFDGKYNRFYTVTGQWNEDAANASEARAALLAAVDSFKLAPL